MNQNKPLSFDDNLTPEECITLMFDRTDEDGLLYIPWLTMLGHLADEVSYRCHMTWNWRDCEKALDEFNALYEDLSKIAALYDKLGDDVQKNRKILGSERLFSTWNTFVRDFDTPGFDRELMDDILDRYEPMEIVKKISNKIANGEELDEHDKFFLKENLDVSVSPEEETLYADYREALMQDVKKRVGPNIGAYYYVLFAQRLCKLLHLDAPEVIVRNEARQLASVMVIHKYAQANEVVDDSLRLDIEKLEQMSDEELDEQSTLLKKNSQKSMAPLFVYLILKKHSNSKTHLRQQDILKLLSCYPYEIKIERKALSRITHNLLDCQLSVRSDKTGVWIEQ